MRKENLTIETGLVELDINGKRTIQLNPSDAGFVETLYGLVSKLDVIHQDIAEKAKGEEDAVKRFDLSRAEDKQMREAVDDVFGAGFCADVFPSIRLFALADGLTVIENFLYALLDKMDEDITANVAKRDARIKKYTDKYSKYQKKFHN